MLFNSIVFIFAFLPAAVAGYYLLCGLGRHRLALFFLSAASLFFYGYWAPKYIALLLFSMTVNYLLAMWMRRLEADGRKKLVVTLGLVFNLALLFYFKYFNFFIHNVNNLTGAGIEWPRIVLPLAISFFTFQKIAFLIDLYRGRITLGKPLEYITFVLFFPQLIAGPIVHYSELAPQLGVRPEMRAATRNIAIGLAIFALGLFKKTVLADTAALYATPVFDHVAQGGMPGFGAAWLASFAYTLQVYFDFSGYSDMAIGLARMFGVLLPLNFHSPLRASNMAELWRRWHMTLSRFVQSYIFQPISMPLARLAARWSRAPFAFFAGSTLVPVFLSMAIIGIWHGAAWNFLLFGVLHGTYIAAYETWSFLTRKRRRKKGPPGPAGQALAHVLTLLCFVAAVVPFRAADTHVTGRFFLAMFPVTGATAADFDWLALMPLGAGGLAAVLAVGYGIVFLLPNTQQFMTRITPALEWARWENVGMPPLRFAWRPSIGWALAMGAIFFFGVAFIMRGTSEFIYFNF